MPGTAHPPMVEVAALDLASCTAVTRLHMVIVAALFAAAFAISRIAAGDVAPGIVGGAIGAVLVYLVLQRAHEYNEAVRRRRERDSGPR